MKTSLQSLLLHDHVYPSRQQAEYLRNPFTPFHSVEVRPPRQGKIPAVPVEFIKGITELQTKWFGVKNTSPLATFEIRRSTPGKLRFQFSVPTKRLERKVRTHLTTQIPGIEFKTGVNGLPVTTEDSLGGGLLTTGRKDWYPLETEFSNPPVNSVVSALHRHAMQDTKFVVQILFQPVIGKPLRRWYWRRRAYQRIGYLRKEKEKLWGSRPPTPREKTQANKVEDKAGTNRFHTSIRFAVIGAGEYTQSRVKEVSGGFNIFENPETGQYLNTSTVRTLRKPRLFHFSKAVAERQLQGWSNQFQTTARELAGLVSTPNRTQENIQYSEP